jgi:hypothetical protein
MIHTRKTVICLGFCALTGLAAVLPLCGEEGTQAPRAFTASEARRRAIEITGLPGKAVKSVSQRTVTDVSAPFEIKDLPVWEVVFEGVKLTGKCLDGRVSRNRKISSLHVWVDRRTGALVKVFSPPPRQGGLKLMLGPKHSSGLGENGVSLGLLPGIPKRSLTRTLASPGSGLPESLPQVTELTAYYGLFSHTLPANAPVVDKPAWFIYLGGVNHGMPSGPFNAPRRDAYASEMLAVLDASTGKSYLTELVGEPAGRQRAGGSTRSRSR